MIRPCPLMIPPFRKLKVASAVLRCVPEDQTLLCKFAKPTFNLRFFQFLVGLERETGVLHKLRIAVIDPEVIRFND